MMRSSSSIFINRRYVPAAPLSVCFLYLILEFRSNLRMPTTADWNLYSASPESASTLLGQPTINATSDDIFDIHAVDSSAIKRVCEAMQWNSSIIFTCDNNLGGIGNVRNSILNCVRYSISAGASLVIPQIVVRNERNLSDIRAGERRYMDYMFDVPHFVQSLRLSCPQLQLYEKEQDMPNSPSQRQAISLVPESLVVYVPRTGLQEPREWRSIFYTWLSQFESPAKTQVIELSRSYLQYPIYSDGEAFAVSFGSILKFRADTRVLATATLRRLSQTFHLGLELQWHKPILKEAFFGVHLRTEVDAKANWPAKDWKNSGYDKQSKLYLSQAREFKHSIIYVASGDSSEVSNFAQDAKSINATVTSKTQLLTGTDKEQLESLTWDQQGLVDFLVMLKSSDFAGVDHSSFAWNIALKRHTLLRGSGEEHLKGLQSLSDELSQIYGLGRSHPEYYSCLWP